MTRVRIAAAIAAAAFIAFAAAAGEEKRYEATLVGVNDLDILAAGPAAMQINVHLRGPVTVTSGAGPSEVWSVECVGALTVLDGKWDREQGICRSTIPNGDVFFSSYESSGEIGKPAEGTWKHLGGTGGLEGIVGDGTFVRTTRPPISATVGVSISEIEGFFSLP